MHYQVVVADQREGSLVGMVQPLAAHLAVQPPDPRTPSATDCYGAVYG